MKIFFTSTIILILLSGCATKNAFSKLNINKKQEKSIENTKSFKLLDGKKVGGVFSAIYLNNVYELENKNIFYLSIFRKNTKEALKITLNNQVPLEVKKLQALNEYTFLLGTNNKWEQGYLVSFEETTSKNLSLLIDSGPFSSGLLKYSKDSQ